MNPTHRILKYGLILVVTVMACQGVVTAGQASTEAQIQASKDAIVLQNEFLSRKLKIGPDGLSTVEFKNQVTKKDYATGPSDEFAFAVDGVEVTGGGAASGFRYVRHAASRPRPGESLLHVELEGRAGTPAENLAVGVDYTIYDRLPFIRKKLSIINRSSREIVLTNLDVERLQMTPVTEFLCEVIANHGASLTRIPYTGDYNDSVVLVWNPADAQGFMLGNEAFGVMKRTEVHVQPQRVSVGLTLTGQHYPFKKYLAPGEKFTSPRTFIGLYQGEKWQDAFEGPFADLVREKLGVRFFEKKDPPLSYYNSWLPWRWDIDEKLIRESIDAVAETGFEVFTIDEGWEDAMGDWNPDPKKFPNGLQPLCDHIIEKGMKPGLWISIASAFGDSRAVLEHPEWTIKDKTGRPANLHSTAGWNGHPLVTMSLATPWYDHNLAKIKEIVRACRLAYLKIDLAAVNSCYVLDYDFSGDYEPKPPFYKDHDSSYYALFERVQSFFDDLHHAFPELIIDCTYEVMGRYNLTDFGTIQHADVNWLSNFSWEPPKGAIQIRQLNFDRGRVIPPSTMFIGNPPVDKAASRYGFFSIAQSIPVMLGDPRRLGPEMKSWLRKWLGWFKEMDRKYRFSAYYQVSDVFDRPGFSNWDGCYRFNREKDGGVLFFFRNGSPDGERTFRVFCVDPGSTYRVYSPETGADLGTFAGKELAENGLKVRIDKPFTALVLGIEKTAGGGAAK
jgi:alpha-galactosidase